MWIYRRCAFFLLIELLAVGFLGSMELQAGDRLQAKVANSLAASLSAANLRLDTVTGDCLNPIDVPIYFLQPDNPPATSISMEISWPPELFLESYFQPNDPSNRPQVLRGASLQSGIGSGFPLLVLPSAPGRWQVIVAPHSQSPATAIPSGELLRIRFWVKDYASQGTFPIRFFPGSVIFTAGPPNYLTISGTTSQDGAITLLPCPITSTTSSTVKITSTTSSSTTSSTTSSSTSSTSTTSTTSSSSSSTSSTTSSSSSSSTSTSTSSSSTSSSSSSSSTSTSSSSSSSLAATSTTLAPTTSIIASTSTVAATSTSTSLAAPTTTLPSETVAWRSVSDCYSQGSAILVTLTIQPPSSTLVYAVEETPPLDWTATNISHNGRWDNSTKRVKWGPFFDAASRAFTYQLTPPLPPVNNVSFFGEVSFNGSNVVIGGSAVVSPCPPPTTTSSTLVSSTTTSIKIQTTTSTSTSSTLLTTTSSIKILTTTSTSTSSTLSTTTSSQYFATTTSTFAITTLVSTTSIAGTTTTLPLTGSATRSFAGCYNEGNVFWVSIEVIPAMGVSVYSIEETTPPGWLVGQIGLGGTWNSAFQQVRWGPFYDDRPRTVSYSITPSPLDNGAHTFRGRVSFNGNIISIGGRSFISNCNYHPADIDANWRLSSEELKSYTTFWKNGDIWVTPPNPIPLEYIIRAASLWKSGELYEYNQNIPCPLCWIPFFGTALASQNIPEKSTIWTTALAGTGTAIRSMPLFYVPEQPVTVYLSLYPDSTTVAYGVEENPPAGWGVQNVDNGGVWDAIQRKIKWGPFFGPGPRTLSYHAIPPFLMNTIAAFSGKISLDGINSNIGGQQNLPPTTTTLIYTTTTTSSTLPRPLSSTTTTTLADTLRFFPKLINTAEERTALSVVNPTNSDVILNFEAYSNDGSLTDFSKQVVLPPAQQLARLIGEIFPNLPGTFSGWLSMRSSSSLVNSFYLLFNDRLDFMDGANPLSKTVSEFVFPLKNDAEFSLVNPDPNRVAPYVLEFVSNQGSVLRSYQGIVPARGRTVLSSNDLYPDPVVPGYFRGYSEMGVIPVEEVKKEGRWNAVLSGLDTRNGAEVLYAPQYVVGNGYETIMDLINLSTSANTLSLELFEQDGRRIGITYQTELPPKGCQRISGTALWGLNMPVNGYVRIRGSKATGSVLFTDPQAQVFASALPFVTSGKKEMLFAQVAQSDQFYTGLAVINLNNLPINIRIEVFDSEWGIRRGFAVIPLQANAKFARLFNELIYPLPLMNRGYFKVSADLPVAAFALFGTWGDQSICAIPQQ